jgi:hypothetical protein
VTAAVVVLSCALAVAVIVGFLGVRSLRKMRRELSKMVSELGEIRSVLVRVAARPIVVSGDPSPTAVAGPDSLGPVAHLGTMTPVIKVRAIGAGTRQAFARMRSNGR